MVWRVWSKSIFTLTTILVAGVLAGCNLLAPNQTTELVKPSLEVPAGGWLLANDHEVWTVSAQEVEGESYSFTAKVKGILIRPVSKDALVFLEEGNTWTIWEIGETDAEVLYSTRVPLSQCSLAPNGHSLVCLQAGDLNLIQMNSGSVERIDTGVVGATWSTNNSDLLVHFSDRTELVGLDLSDHVASRTQLSTETGDHPQFLNGEQVVWWRQTETERQLVLFSLRTKELSVIWTGQAGEQSWVSSKGNRILFSDQDICTTTCLSQVISLPQGQVLQTIEGQNAAGWLQQDAVVKTPLTPIDQGTQQTYHFAAVSDGSELSLGDAQFLATDNHLEIVFEP